jgi:hypothetical protein
LDPHAWRSTTGKKPPLPLLDGPKQAASLLQTLKEGVAICGGEQMRQRTDARDWGQSYID